MSKQSDLIAAFTNKRLEDNLNSFRDYLPDVYNIFKDYSEKRYYLIYDKDGNVNLFDKEKGRLLYSNNPFLDAVSELDSYVTSPSFRPYIMGCKESEDEKKIIPVHHKLTTSLGALQYECISHAFGNRINLKDEGADGLSLIDFGVLPDVINSFVVFSTGVGFDIEKLYFSRKIENLFIVENCFDSFYASLQLIDWSSIIDDSISNGKKIYFFLSEDVDGLLDDLKGFIPGFGRHKMAGCYVYSSFFNDSSEEIYNKFKSALDVSIFAGFGFYDDSRMSVAHSIGNIRNKVPCIKSDKSIGKRHGQENIPVFLIGSGPSLDDDIEFIKKNKEKVVILSCGSALKSLYVNGIKPDFHVELERTAHVLHWIKKSSESDDFKKYLSEIIFIGASQVHPDVFSLFGRSGQLPKDTETGSLILHKVLGEKGVPLITRVAPTCVHMGLTVAVLLGFRSLYLFGVDMGYKSYDSHHSKYSLYTELDEGVSAKLVASNKDEIEVEPNFDGEAIYASGFFPMFKHFLDAQIVSWVESFSGLLSVYNCSNGAKISGTKGVRSSELSFDDLAFLSKEDVCEKIYSSFFSYVANEEDFSSLTLCLETSFSKVDQMCDWLSSSVYSVSSVEEAAELVNKFSIGFHHDLEFISDEDSYLYSLFDGSFLYALSAVNSILFMPIKEDVRVLYFNKMMIVLVDFLRELALDFRNNALIFDKEEYYDFFK